VLKFKTPAELSTPRSVINLFVRSMSNSIACRKPLPSDFFNWLAVKPITTFGRPESGLIWIDRRASNAPAGAWAGCLTKQVNGHAQWKIKFNKDCYLVSRVVYFLSTGHDPGKFEIDHIDRNSLNNNIANLRLAGRSQQNHNRCMLASNSSGARGVSWIASAQKWRAQLRIHKKLTILGEYDCKLEAAIAYNTAVANLCEDFYRSKANDISALTCTCARCYP